jgi:2-polyprenyl-3-methyl-5-hydroxy-6-metoxy-1,4-benzoquinol methylase
MWGRFASRSGQLEMMDDLNCTGIQVDQTLRELEIINRLLGGNRITLDGVNELLKGHKPEENIIEIADLGCGGGDMLKVLARWGRRAGIKLRLVGIDANPGIIDYARKNSLEYPEIDYQVLDIFSPRFRQREFDIITCTLFTHHFTSDQLVPLFRDFGTQSRIGVVINDLHRHWFAYWSIKLLTSFFSTSAMIKNDAPISVLRGFNRQELQQILSDSSIYHYQLVWRWAFRWQIILRS